MAGKENTLQEFGKYVSQSVLSQLGVSCYILADTYFISKGVGADGLTALNLAIPVFSVMNGCGFMLGIGSGTKYGIMKGTDKKTMRDYLDAMEQAGVVTTEPRHKTLRFTPASGAVLFHGKPVSMTQAAETAAPRKRSASAPDAPLSDGAERVLTALKQTRRDLAEREGVPLYVIFSNATLADMAARQPSSEYELLSVRGVGDAKARRYGKDFLAVIRKYRDENLGK